MLTRALVLAILSACAFVTGCAPNPGAKVVAPTGAGEAAKPVGAPNPVPKVVAPTDAGEPAKPVGAPNPAPKVVAPTDAGEAAKAVEKLFTNWDNKLYAEMLKQLTGIEDEKGFPSAMEHTPVRWRRAEITKEEAVGDSWYVHVTVEVTDLQSLMGAFLFNHTSSFREKITRDDPIPAAPENLHIETFTSVKQIWRVAPVDGHLRISVAEQKKDKKCADELILYFRDAVRLTYVTERPGDPIGMFRIHMARIMVQLSGHLGGMSQDEITAMIPEVKKKAESAHEFFKAILDGIDEALDKSKQGRG